MKTSWSCCAVLAAGCSWSADLPFRKELPLRMALTPAAGTQTCVVRLDIADLEVVSSPGAEASLEGTLEVRTAEEADLSLAWTTPSLVATDRGLQIQEPPVPAGLRGRHQLQHRLKLALPAALALEVRIAVGSAKVRDRAAGVTVDVNVGEAWIDRARGPVVARVTTGEVMVREHQGAATLRVTTGNVFLGLLRAEGAVELQATTGDVTVRLLGEMDFTVKASTDIGQLQSDVPLERKTTHTGASGSGKSGSGASPLTARTSIGTIAIRVAR